MKGHEALAVGDKEKAIYTFMEMGRKSVQLKQAEAVFRKAAKETALKTGFIDSEDPIVFYHSFEPKYAEVFCRLIEERFRAGGGKRQIEFIWQESAPAEWEDYAEALRRPRSSRQVFEHSSLS